MTIQLTSMTDTDREKLREEQDKITMAKVELYLQKVSKQNEAINKAKSLATDNMSADDVRVLIQSLSSILIQIDNTYNGTQF